MPLPAIRVVRLMMGGRAYAALLAVVLVARAQLRADEVALGLGAMTSPASDHVSYAWHLDYRHRLAPNLDWAATWLNEGHVDGHHRDGLAGQLWYEFQPHDKRWAFGAGLGGYHYFDTQKQPGGDSLIQRGWAGLGSLAATYHPRGSLFWRLTANVVLPTENFTATTLTLAVGYRRAERPAVPVTAAAEKRNEATVLLGKTVVNASVGKWDEAGMIEYRRTLSQQVAVSAAWLVEGDTRVLDRQGPAAELWLAKTWLEHRLELGLGAGVYFAHDRRRASNGDGERELMKLVSPTVAYRLNSDWAMRVVWHRVISRYHRDTDVFLLGTGRRW